MMQAWCVIPFALLAMLGTASAEEWRISTSGFGPAKFGMAVAEAAQALQRELIVDGEIDSPRCYYVKPRPPIAGLAIMVSHGRVVRFDVTEPGITTLSGLGVGDTEARVIEVLGPSVEITPHKYLAPEGNYLTLWSENRRFAVRFETHLGKVTSFYAGRLPEVRHVEGCA